MREHIHVYKIPRRTQGWIQQSLIQIETVLGRRSHRQHLPYRRRVRMLMILMILIILSFAEGALLLT
jgi:hypothetical protein